MSKISPIYEAITDRTKELFIKKTRIPNPYSLKDNPELLIKDGYGIKIGSATQSEQVEFCSMIIDRTISVVLTREILRLEKGSNEIDRITKAMLEDVYSLQNLYYSYNELGIECKIRQVNIGDVTGIEQVDTEKFNALFMEASFIFTIAEPL